MLWTSPSVVFTGEAVGALVEEAEDKEKHPELNHVERSSCG